MGDYQSYTSQFWQPENKTTEHPFSANPKLPDAGRKEVDINIAIYLERESNITKNIVLYYKNISKIYIGTYPPTVDALNGSILISSGLQVVLLVRRQDRR